MCSDSFDALCRLESSRDTDDLGVSFMGSAGASSKNCPA